MSSRAEFVAAVRAGRVLLMDGAMGTELMRAGLRVPEEVGERWNLARPEVVRTIHQSYLEAGAECLLTNTFSIASLVGDPVERQELYEEGLRLARSAGKGNCWILGSMGPPPRTWHEDASCYVRQAGWLRAADAVVLETQSQLAFPGAFLEAALAAGLAVPLIVSFCYAGSGGLPGAKDEAVAAARWAERNKSYLVALGVNCGTTDMKETAAIIRRYRQETGLPILARPSAGIPKREGRLWRYPRTPEQMAAELPELLEAGVTLVGGCCGTTPAHIAVFAPVIRYWNRRQAQPH
jgi:5-methyltetrahydrofolate--homocysteine methyltransferase